MAIYGIAMQDRSTKMMVPLLGEGALQSLSTQEPASLNISWTYWFLKVLN